jgi:hypothetical protein
MLARIRRVHPPKGWRDIVAEMAAARGMTQRVSTGSGLAVLGRGFQNIVVESGEDRRGMFFADLQSSRPSIPLGGVHTKFCKTHWMRDWATPCPGRRLSLTAEKSL